MKIETPQVCHGDLVAAWEQARASLEPRFVPAPVHVDDRGWSLMNQFQGVLAAQGQINYSVVYPGVVKAWHRHQGQTDFWLCLHGHLKVGVFHEDAGRLWQIVVGEKRPGVLIVPPPLWHGLATVGPDSAGLLYYVTQQYDPTSPDEDRRPFDSVEGFSWGVEHR